MKKVLIIGGAGYIGGLTTDILIDRGFNVTVFDNLLYENRFLKNCNFIYGDIRDTNKLLKVHNNYDEIIWLAAIVGDGTCTQNPELTMQVNVGSIRDFLKKAKRKIIFTSTCSVYGAQRNLLNEKSKTSPLSLYASSKLEAEKYVSRNNGLIFRLGTLFGLGDRHSRIRLDLVVNFLTLKSLRDKTLTIFGGNQWRPIISVIDVAEYLSEAVNSNTKGVFNIKYKNIKIVDLSKIFLQCFTDLQIHKTKRKFEDLRNYRVDSRKALRYFKYRPIVTVAEEVERMKKLFLEQRIKNVDDSIYYNMHYVKRLIENNKL